MSRITIEDLLSHVPIVSWLAKFLDFHVLLVRVYPKHVEPIEPNPFKFAVVAIILGGIATIKGMHHSDVKVRDLRDGATALAKFGAVELRWRHDGVERVFRA